MRAQTRARIKQELHHAWLDEVQDAEPVAKDMADEAALILTEVEELAALSAWQHPADLKGH